MATAAVRSSVERKDSSSQAGIALLGLMHVDFNLTNACNLACNHCHSASGKALPDELTTAEITDAVNQLHAMGALSVAFAGGEPFMRRDILEVIEHACHLDGWTVSVITNGMFLTDRMIGALLDRCPRLGLNVSVDGSNPDIFSLLRAQPGATSAARAALFRRVTDGVRLATSSGLVVSVNTTMTRATIHDLRATYDLAINELGAQAVVATSSSRPVTEGSTLRPMTSPPAFGMQSSRR